MCQKKKKKGIKKGKKGKKKVVVKFTIRNHILGFIFLPKNGECAISCMSFPPMSREGKKNIQVTESRLEMFD